MSYVVELRNVCWRSPGDGGRSDRASKRAAYPAERQLTCLEVPGDQVVIKALPRNTTSMHQPLHMGVIAYVKRMYGVVVLDKIVQTLPEREQLQAMSSGKPAGTRGLVDGAAPNIMDVACSIKSI